MSDIKAFVAHSFNANDEDLIGIFVRHFDSLAKSIPGFEWDHAEQAEPGSISVKVLKKIEDKNLFIAICSKYEYAASPKTASKVPILRRIQFNLSDVQWKASDWIIQEIGLAVGRNMKVIIFVEEGVRKPGGLSGDIEYIPFSRKNPHASFDKLLQMLGTLVARPVQSSPALAEAKSSPSDDAPEASHSENNWEPQTGWDQGKYDGALAWAIFLKRDGTSFNTINEAYRLSPFYKSAEAQTIWEARIEFLRMIADEKPDFKKMKKAAQDYPANSELTFFVARGYHEYGDFLMAARTYEDAANKTEDKSRKVRYLINAFNQYDEAGDRQRSDAIMEMLKQHVLEDQDLQCDLLDALRSFAEERKNSEIQLAALERLVALRPDNTSARFSLAYKHAEIGNSDMALHHYLTIPPMERNGTTWNNLGVEYDNFEMPAKAIDAYRTAETKEETLAMSNIGYKLLNLGFIEEARKQADKAIAIKNYHKNVPELLKNLSEVAEKEEAKLTAVLDKVKPVVAYYRKAGEGLLKSTPTSIASRWKSPEGAVLEAKIDGLAVSMLGSYEREVGILAGLLSPYGGYDSSQKTVKQQIEYKGEIRGGVIVGYVRRFQEGETPSMLSAGNDRPKVMMVFKDDFSELLVLEGQDTPHSRIYLLTRV